MNDAKWSYGDPPRRDDVRINLGVDWWDWGIGVSLDPRGLLYFELGPFALYIEWGDER